MLSLQGYILLHLHFRVPLDQVAFHTCTCSVYSDALSCLLQNPFLVGVLYFAPWYRHSICQPKSPSHHLSWLDVAPASIYRGRDEFRRDVLLAEQMYKFARRQRRCYGLHTKFRLVYHKKSGWLSLCLCRHRVQCTRVHCLCSRCRDALCDPPLVESSTVGAPI